MSDSAARVVPAEVTRAVRDSVTDAGEVHEGDWIGISRDGVVASPTTSSCAPPARSAGLLDESHELVTLIEGEGRGWPTRGGSRSGSRRSTPTSPLEVHQGGQPLYPYLLGIE